MSVPVLGGLVAAVATPRRPDGTVDEEAFGRLIAALTARGVQGHFVAGGQGQGWLLDDRQVAGLVSAAGAAAGGRAVLCGVTSGSTKASLARARVAAAEGASHVVATPPLGTGVDDAALRAYLVELSEESPVPVVLYNHPARTGRTIPVALAAELAGHPNVAGLKDSSGSMLSLCAYLALRTDSFRVLVGHDSLVLAALAYGCDGAVASTANVIPSLLSELMSAATGGDLVTARAVQAKVHRLRMFDEAAFVAVVQQAVTLLGIPSGLPPHPTPTLEGVGLDRLRALLDEIGAERLEQAA
ncbi:MAG: dihydrodipicolinate synthase family protein [Microbacteriaceae bacterium]|nr:dihydrodipicolinate synthase family protein [Microbacteriaceae bacterium]